MDLKLLYLTKTTLCWLIKIIMPGVNSIYFLERNNYTFIDHLILLKIK